MNLSDLLPLLQKHPALGSVLAEVARQSADPVQVSVADAAKPYALAALHTSLERPLLVIAARPSQARALRDEIVCWHPRTEDVLLFPEQDALPFEPLPADPQTSGERLAVLTRLLEGEGAPLVIASGRATADLLARPSGFAEASVSVRVGDRIRPDELLERLLRLGYEPSPVVDSPGQYGRRGGIVDVYPLVGEPCRIEFFGDEIDSLRSFDPLSQRSTAQLERLLVTPTADRPLPGEPGGESTDASADNAAPSATLLDYLPPSAMLVLDEPHAIAAAAEEIDRQVEGLHQDLVARGEVEPDAQAFYLPWPELARRIDQDPIARLVVEHDPDDETLPFTQSPAFGGRLRHFLQECARLAAAGQRVVIVSQQSQRLEELLDESGGAGDSRRPTLVHGQLQSGLQSEALKLTVFTDSEIFGWQKIRRPQRPRKAAGRQSFLTELASGDLVVHIEHGIAYYRGMVTMAGRREGPDGRADGGDATEREYLLLEYAAGDRLYVPADQADRITRYIGAGDAAPQPTRLGSGEWNRAKNRVRKAVREIANELLELYAARQDAEGLAFPPDTPWQAELEGSFPYVETPDQLRALDEVKRDMESPRPMDRLLVGDVGYGKTEVALRAAFKAVEAGKQVGVLVPTTVLAQQHWNTFRERLAPFPVRVEMLSRFRSDAEQREVVKGLADGSVDICIGTHRILQKDVAFKDLGLVIVDEEQRFGVVHKERLKQLRREVDVLTLTATPIPRTLHMSLVGVRDMSTIETPPEERLPIRTYVTEHDQGLVRESILRELDRGGQVYYVHNRVKTIAFEASRLQQLVPEARIAVGHGQMPEDQLEQVMLDFAAGRYDVLVCTTIIESGLDIPSVNTLIVNNSHRFGLSQLYQLRGRVGRGAARAYAYFLYTRDTALTEVAEKRLRTIFEATELGAGFRIALKDLEIRGAGNLLGAEQHGHISAVGFDLYTRLLAEAVGQLKQARAALAGTRPTAGAPTLALASAAPAPSVSLPVTAFLPPEYVEDDATRLGFYQRLAGVQTGPELGELVDELIDRFGPLPEPAQNLVYVVSLRLAARRAGVQQIQSMDGEVVVRFDRLPRVDVASLTRAVGAPLRAGSNQLRLARGRGLAWMAHLRTLVESLPAAG